MASTTTNAGLYLWDLGTDNYNHSQLQANFVTLDSYLAGFDATSKFVKHIHTTASIPGTAALGDVVFLTASAGGFAANSLIRYDGSAWKVTGYEVLAAVPGTGNWNGRLVLLSAADSGFNAWTLIRYNGTTWDYAGSPWGLINNGALATNIKGLQQSFDTYINDSARGFVLVDRTSGTKYRLYIDNGTLATEVVT
jgi:hypothetical protein